MRIFFFKRIFNLISVIVVLIRSISIVTAWQLIDLLIMPRFDHSISDFIHLKGPRGIRVRWFRRRLFYGFSMMNKNEIHLLISLYIEITNKIFCIILHLILILLVILTLISILIRILILIFQFSNFIHEIRCDFDLKT